MNARLNDLRLLRTAVVIELGFERVAMRVVRSMVQDPAARRALQALSEPDGPHADRILVLIRRLLTELSPEQHAELARAALLSLRDTEGIAAQFYERYRRELVDPAAAALFDELAAEERGHVAAVEAALQRLSADGPALIDDHPFAPELQFLHDLETFEAKA